MATSIMRITLKAYDHQLVDASAKKIIDTVKKNGGEVIQIGIIEENTRLKRWYERFGFVATGTKRFAYLPFTVGFMELRFS